jgi:predicted enzyme related to lactoylglutathione lyase
MPSGKIETVILNVKDIEKSIKFYSDLLDTTFESVRQYTLPGGIEIKEAFSPSVNLDLIQQTNPTLDKEGVRATTLRVKNIEEAASRIEKMGIPLLRELKGERAHMVEKIYQMNGYLLILAQHDDM